MVAVVVLRRIDSMKSAQPAIALALEYGRWAASVAKDEYAIDAKASQSLGEEWVAGGSLSDSRLLAATVLRR